MHFLLIQMLEICGWEYRTRMRDRGFEETSDMLLTHHIHINTPAHPLKALVRLQAVHIEMNPHAFFAYPRTYLYIEKINGN